MVSTRRDLSLEWRATPQSEGGYLHKVRSPSFLGLAKYRGATHTYVMNIHNSYLTKNCSALMMVSFLCHELNFVNTK